MLFLLSIPILIPLYGYSVFLKDHYIYQGLPYYAQLALVLFLLLTIAYLIQKINNKEGKEIRYIQTLIVCILFLFILPLTLKLPPLTPLLLTPVIIAATTWGKRVGILVGSLAGLALLASNFIPFLRHFAAQTFQLDLVNAGVIVLLSWFIGGLSDIEAETRNTLAHLADTDGLTGLYNHRCFQERLRDLLEEAEKNNTPLSLLLLDLDHFKFYNDTQGHQKGDRALAELGELLSRLVPAPYFAARYGGEEFVVVLPGATRQEAQSFGEYLAEKIASHSFEGAHNLPQGRLTASFGLACYPEDGSSAQELVEAADHALYQAKYSRRLHFYFSVVDRFRALSRSERELFNSLKILLALINVRDRYTYGHSERVGDYAAALAQKLGLPPAEVELLRCGAYLHDIGKVEVPFTVLNKPGRLDNGEWEVIKKHPEWGESLIKPLSSFSSLLPLIRHHHENYDGTGYPDGLKGEEIPLFARILRIADSYDAMTTERPYKKARTPLEACRVLQEEAGKAFDPYLVRLFTEVILEREAAGRAKAAP
ncbi:bifunctional diguanylate cyclase/phosphohydrolase [Desulfovirgula thermocuniculi]|uniref:bifunctional diguanylate cyclase/phosphohydrolase n=1 Tax=Desulfovirgula thermocuniculi TaxID=348842 RepID=UPI00068534CB|nr:diguanylate cyclase [Desulfovirgula thermocuniculi]